MRPVTADLVVHGGTGHPDGLATGGWHGSAKARSSMQCMVALYSVCLGPGKLGGQRSIRSLRGREVQKWQSWWWVKLLA